MGLDAGVGVAEGGRVDTRVGVAEGGRVGARVGVAEGGRVGATVNVSRSGTVGSGVSCGMDRIALEAEEVNVGISVGTSSEAAIQSVPQAAKPRRIARDSTARRLWVTRSTMDCHDQIRIDAYYTTNCASKVTCARDHYVPKLSKLVFPWPWCKLYVGFCSQGVERAEMSIFPCTPKGCDRRMSDDRLDQIEGWKRRARQLKQETYALYLAYRDPRTPWYARVFAACVVGYAFSPIDLIPDIIPVLGYLDDLILVPLGVAIALRMIPPPVMAECWEKARVALEQDRPTNWAAAVVIVAIWLLLAALAITVVVRAMGRGS